MTDWICQDCGDVTSGESDWSSWDCILCGGQVLTRSESTVTPNDELEELLKDMRNNIEWERSNALGRDEWADGLEIWANKLEELIDDE